MSVVKYVELNSDSVMLLYFKIGEAVRSLSSKLSEDGVDLHSSADVATRFFVENGKMYVELTHWKDKEKNKMGPRNWNEYDDDDDSDE